MSNVLSDEKRQQVIALGRLGWSLRRIEEATGVRRETVGSYLKAAGMSVRPPGRWGWQTAKPANGVTTDSGAAKAANEANSDPDISKPAIKVTTDSAGAKPAPEAGDPDASRPLAAVQTQSSRSISACEPYREVIEWGLNRGRNAMAIWQDLVTEHGFDRSYQSVKRFVHKLRPSELPQAHPVIVTAPGEEAQVDYGTGPMVRDQQGGKYRRTRLFVMIGFSRKSVRLLVFRSSSRVWAELDNLREGVLTPDIYDPTLNPLYRDLLAHYGVVAMPCRVRDPDRKGKVEAGVGHAQKTPLKGQRFESLEEAQAYLDHWETRWADTRIHGTTKRQVAAMFAEEKPHLLPLPLEPFRSYQYGERAVHLDGCVEVEAAYYSAPPGWIGRRIQVQWDTFQVRLIDPKTGQLLREHLRQKRGWHRIKEEDRPPRTPLSTNQLLTRAGHAGANIGTLCQAIHGRQGQVGVRRILGVLSLAKKFGAAVVDDACSAALEMGVHEYHFVRRYLERQPQLPLSLHQVDPLIRELVQYRDLIHQRTKEQEPNESD
jgi:hypothetical protein